MLIYRNAKGVHGQSKVVGNPCCRYLFVIETCTVTVQSQLCGALTFSSMN